MLTLHGVETKQNVMWLSDFQIFVWGAICGFIACPVVVLVIIKAFDQILGEW